MTTSYQSPIPYVGERIHAAAIYCSDGRVGEHFDDFLTNGLCLPRYDRVALPGGPACLAGHREAHLEQAGVLDELRFLVEAHELDRVVLIQHEACAFYEARLGVSGAEMKTRQIDDIARATTLIKDQLGIAKVEAYFARRTGATMHFDVIACE